MPLLLECEEINRFIIQYVCIPVPKEVGIELLEQCRSRALQVSEKKQRIWKASVALCQCTVVLVRYFNANKKKTINKCRSLTVDDN